MICAAFRAIVVAMKRHRNGKEWHLATAAAGLGERQLFFGRDEEHPPQREAPVRFPGELDAAPIQAAGSGWSGRCGSSAAVASYATARLRGREPACRAQRDRSTAISPGARRTRRGVPVSARNMAPMILRCVPAALRKPADRGKPTTRCAACS